MSRETGQKLKMLYLKDYLLRYSDEKHPVTKAQILEMLAGHEITVTRQTLHTDLMALSEEYGLDIVEQGNSLFVAGRDFETEEVRMLVDMVQTSNFITKKKTGELIEKLQGLTSIHEAKSLNRQVYVRNRVKTMNENVYRNLDRISAAIADNRKVRFQYYRYNVNKERDYRHGGKEHLVSPFALIYVDQNYYLLGYDPLGSKERLRHYRIDRMANLAISKAKREGFELFEKEDMSKYTTKVFYMFTGDDTLVTMRFANHLTDPVIDRFGEEVMMHPDGPDRFTVSTEVVVSPQFYAWMSAYGAEAEILAPESVREGMKKHMQDILSVYDKGTP